MPSPSPNASRKPRLVASHGFVVAALFGLCGGLGLLDASRPLNAAGPVETRTAASAAMPAASPAAPPSTQSAWPQWGGSAARNGVAEARNLPERWNVGTIDRKTGQWLGVGRENVVWAARLGGEGYGSPVVADGRVFCATNNAGYLSRFPRAHDLGCMLGFEQASGRFLWQYSAEKLAAGRNVDWPNQGICSTPVVEGDRLWLVSNRGEVVCLRTEATGEARVVWTFDMMERLGSIQRYMAACSPTTAGDLLLVGTSNGRDPGGKLPAPAAPSFVALDKRTGKLAWADNSPGENLLDGQWGSPAAAVLGGVPQAIFPGGDGWLYSFEARPTADAKPKLLWKFDCNRKESRWESGGSGTRNTLISTPVVYSGRVYIATGQDPESGDGVGCLWCIDPTRRGDVSSELVVDREGKPVAPRRLCAVDKAAGERVVPNPNSAAVWRYGSGLEDASDAGTSATPGIRRCLGMPAVSNGLLVIGDFTGIVHCLDAATGKVQWTHDLMASIWGSPLIADGKIYLGNRDGDVAVFTLDRRPSEPTKNEMGGPVLSTAAACGDTLYIATTTHLFALRKQPGTPPGPQQGP